MMLAYSAKMLAPTEQGSILNDVLNDIVIDAKLAPLQRMNAH